MGYSPRVAELDTTERLAHVYLPKHRGFKAAQTGNSLSVISSASHYRKEGYSKRGL